MSHNSYGNLRYKKNYSNQIFNANLAPMFPAAAPVTPASNGEYGPKTGRNKEDAAAPDAIVMIITAASLLEKCSDMAGKLISITISIFVQPIRAILNGKYS